MRFATRPPCLARSPRRRCGGLAAVEMVLVLPVLLVTIVATVDLGRAFYQYVTLTGAVRDAGRYLAANAVYGSTGVVDFSKIPDVLAATRNLAVYANPQGSGAPVLPQLARSDVSLQDLGGGDVGVTCTYTYRPLLADVLPVFPPIVEGGGAVPLGVDMTAAVSMRAL
jgi:Flp pilus assembly protein TadG